MPEKPTIHGIYEATHDLQQSIINSTFLPPELYGPFLEGINNIYAEIEILDRQLVEINGTNK